MGKSKQSPERVRAREREAKALELRKAGATYTQIAKQLEMTEPGAYKVVTRVLERLARKATESYESVLRLELERLDVAMLSIWPQVRAGNLGAIDRALKIMDRRAKYLGLDSPLQIASDMPAVVLPAMSFGSLDEWAAMARGDKPGQAPQEAVKTP